MISGSEVVSIVAIVAGAAGTLGGVYFGGWREDSRLRQEAARAELKERDDLIDTAAEAITEALSAFERRKTSFEDNVQQRGEAFDDRIQSVALVETRVAVRFTPDHPATNAYRGALIALRNLARKVFEAQSVGLDAAFGQDDYRHVDEAKNEFLLHAQASATSLRQ